MAAAVLSRFGQWPSKCLLLCFLPRMMEPNLTAILVAVAGLLYFYTRRRLRSGSDLNYSRRPLPPGPKKVPLLGNLLNMPASPEWETYHKLAQELESDVIHISAAGTNIVVLNTFEAAFELLEKRSSIYSSRVHLTMISDLLGMGFAMGVLQYGERWRQLRRVVHQSLHPTAATLFRPHSLKASRNFLNRLLDNPGDVIGSIRLMTAESILSITYGIDILPDDDPYIKVAEHAMEGFGVAAVPGAFLVDSLPILKYVPEWFPGAGFQKRAREWKNSTALMLEAPFAAAKALIASGKSRHSFVSASFLTDGGLNRNNVIKDAAGTMYGGGVDTTMSATASCILGFLDKPEVLKKAQLELDRVLKPGHLPDFQDQESLPYITAITMEVLRWRTVVPIAVPHLSMANDIYNGYRIPAGTIVIANAWAMLHDEDVYPDPFTFNPDRFIQDGKLRSDVWNPGHACWGFGRRICPGRYMAFSSIWITIASIAAVFDIKKAVDEDGNVIEPTHEYYPALISVPKPFKCSVTPRSLEAEQLIRASAMDHKFDN